MGILDRFRKKKKEREKPKVVPRKPSMPSIRPNSLDQFAREACKSRSSVRIQIIQSASLIDMLKETLQREYPDLDSGEVFSHAQNGLTLRCITCGTQFSQQALSLLYLAGKGTMQSATFGGPNVATLARGRCPGCGGSTVEATFDPAKIKARQEAIEVSALEATEVPKLVSLCPSVKFQSSLDVSPDEDLTCFVAPEADDKGTVTAYEAGTSNQRWSLSFPSSESCRCMFVAPERVLILSKKSENESVIQLVNTTDGSVVAEAQGPKVYFNYGTADPNKGFFVTESSYDTLLMIQTGEDKLEFSTYECGQIYGPGPLIGPDGKCYVIVHYRLYRIEDKQKKQIMPGNNCICFDPTGKVYCGGGFADRSGESALHIADIESGNMSEIPYGREPIDQIALAGPGRLLLANIVNEIHAGRYPNAVVTLFSISDRKKIWSLEIKDLKPWREPVLLSVPEEGWALIQTGKLLKQISLEDGKTLRVLPKQTQEFVEARWLESKKILYISRNPERGYRKRAPGLIECYRV
jgi:hypothetical protein